VATSTTTTESAESTVAANVVTAMVVIERSALNAEEVTVEAVEEATAMIGIETTMVIVKVAREIAPEEPATTERAVSAERAAEDIAVNAEREVNAETAATTTAPDTRDATIAIMTKKRPPRDTARVPRPEEPPERKRLPNDFPDSLNEAAILTNP